LEVVLAKQADQIPNGKNVLISVVIPTCNRNDMLAKCLFSLGPGKQVRGDIEGSMPDPSSNLPLFTYEVVVTDDGSKTNAQEMIRTSYPWVRWVAGPRKGPAANRNNGAYHAQAEWLVFVDDDCLPEPTLLAAYSKVTTGEVAPVLEGKTSAIGVRTRVDMECPVNETGGYLWSCNMAITKDLFFAIGGFDTSFPGSAMEDVDLRTRLIKSGKRIQFVPEALVLHPWRRKKGMAFWRLHSRSRAYYIAKHPETAEAISLRLLGLELGRKLLRQLPPVALACRGRGLGRELLLALYITYALLAAQKEASRQHAQDMTRQMPL
jgi:GT2 family glycosyltransferase